MARWQTIPDDDCGRLIEEIEERARLSSINGTLLPDDDAVVGRLGFVGVATELGLSTSRAYAAVNTAFAQPWMLWFNGRPGTMASSLTNFLTYGRHELAAARRAAQDWSAIGNRPARPGRRPRGRPTSRRDG